MDAGRVRPRLQAVVVAFAVAVAAIQFGVLAQDLASSATGSSGRPSRWIEDLALLGFGVMLVASAPRRSGISFGTAVHRNKAVLACLAVLAVAAAYRYSGLYESSDTAFSRLRLTLSNGGSAASFWLISPLAQELVFSGFIFGYLHDCFPRRWHSKLPITTAVAITALLFGMWHFIPDYVVGNAASSSDFGFAAFRFLYTAAGMVVYVATRLWTGSIAYAVATHTAVNFIFFERSLFFEL